MNQIIEIDHQDFSFIGMKSEITGTLTFKGETKIAGQIHGEVHLKEDSPLTIEPHGHVEGTIFCHNAFIFGKVTGKIVATGKVIFYPHSRFTGDIRASDFVILPGSLIDMSGETLET